MSEITKPAVKAKMPTKAAQIAFLEGEVKTRDAELQRRALRIAELEEILQTRQRAEAAAAEEVRVNRKALAALMEAIKPVELATREWGSWPADGLAVIRKLTFGHLKRLLSAYQQAQSR